MNASIIVLILALDIVFVVFLGALLIRLMQEKKVQEAQIRWLKNEFDKLLSQTIEMADDESDSNGLSLQVKESDGDLKKSVLHLMRRRKSPKEIAEILGRGVDEIQFIMNLIKREGYSV